jgi:hypothetical protein
MDPFSDGLPEELEEAAQQQAAKGRGRWADRDEQMHEAIARAAEALPTWDRESPVQPVTIRHTPVHGYKKGPKGSRGCKLEVDGKACGKAKAAIIHYLPTVNETLTQDWEVYQGARKHWLPWLVDQLVEAGLPLGLNSVIVEAMYCFPDRRTDRDKGNFRGFIEKVLGDALELGGWIKRDSWNTYDFSGVRAQYVRGERVSLEEMGQLGLLG